MGEDWRLIRLYVDEGSHEAFSRLAGQYLRLVYSVCLHEVGNAQMAEDATQTVFLLLSRKAPSLNQRTVLSGWLYHTARLVARSLYRRERRRAAIERKAARETAIEIEHEHCATINTNASRLHEALDCLRTRDRDVLLLRFFENKSLVEVGETLGVSEDAARMRVGRALDKLRRSLDSTGYIASGATIASLLSEPAGLTPPLSISASLHQIAAAGLANKAGIAFAGWHLHQIARAVAQAIGKANIKTAAVLLGVGVTTAPFVIYPVVPSHPRTQTSLGSLYAPGDTKARAAQEAMRRLNEVEAMQREQSRLFALLQNPDGEQNLSRAMAANPRSFLPQFTRHWMKIRSRSGSVRQAYLEVDPIPTFRKMERAARGRDLSLSKRRPLPMTKIFPEVASPVLTINLAYGQSIPPAVLHLSGTPEQLRRQLQLITEHRQDRAKPRNGQDR